MKTIYLNLKIGTFIIFIAFLSSCKTSVELYYSYEPNTISEEEKEFAKTLAKWTSNLANNLKLKYKFKAKELDAWPPDNRFSYHDNKTYIRVVRNEDNPSYDANNHFIEMPISLYKDPVILLHELVHYITDKFIHLSANQKYNNAPVKEKGCLNLLVSCRSSAEPFTFLLTESQKKDINCRNGGYNTEEVTAQHIFPKYLVEEYKIEDKIDCCHFIELSEEKLNSYYTDLLERELWPYEKDELQRFLNLTLEEINKRGVCPIEISVQGITGIVEDIEPWRNQDTTTYQPSMGTGERGPNFTFEIELLDTFPQLKLKVYKPANKIKFKSEKSRLVYIATDFINQNLIKNKSIQKEYEMESDYLADIFEADSAEIAKIRKRSFNYMLKRKAVRKQSKLIKK